MKTMSAQNKCRSFDGCPVAMTTQIGGAQTESGLGHDPFLPLTQAATQPTMSYLGSKKKKKFQAFSAQSEEDES